ncbi:cysteine-rich protein 2-binding protein [Cloeon dipterum]|uniref:cysteine-rich protein 2-binding protein n=1 Tax=Cloeon dipterum TaxID=197152 RepID=UPI0032203274
MESIEFSKCSRCLEMESKESSALQCSVCSIWCHLTCIDNKSPVFLQDAFFTFTCDNCSDNGQDKLIRDSARWKNIVILILYNLHHQHFSKSRRGYFQYRSQITEMINTNWRFLFPPDAFKKNKAPHGVVSNQLTHNTHIFVSGTSVVGESGWWRLVDPSLSPLYLSKLKKGTAAVVNSDDQPARPQTNMLSVSSSLIENQTSFTLPDILLEKDGIDSDMEIDPPSSPSKIQNSDPLDILSFLESEDTQTKTIPDAEDSTVSQSLQDEPQSEPEKPAKVPVQPTAEAEPVTKFRPMTQYEEVHLMHRLERAGPLPTSKAHRLYRKLVVRNLQRKNGLPLFNLACSPTGHTLNDPSLSNDPKFARILDRFNVSSSQLKNVDNNSLSFMTRLMGMIEPASFKSPNTGRLLKPYIMREDCSKFPWVKLMNELVNKVNKNEPERLPSKNSTLDYCYVRPQHIPAVNSLCRENFWPGIDMSEALQYPEFSCVALYKKLVVGFAFLVDTAMNESYITFLYVRPEWRRGGVATFMLYHLIQTCMGKDVTLHVSATNPALILYQRFGFKVEEFVQDFYEKYLPADSKECTHAFFLRLSR